LGATPDGALVEVFVSATGTWTVLLSSAEGVMLKPMGATGRESRARRESSAKFRRKRREFRFSLHCGKTESVPLIHHPIELCESSGTVRLLAGLNNDEFRRFSMVTRRPAIPPENRSSKGTGADPDPVEKVRKYEPENLSERGDQANIKQNTTNQGYQQDR
jgi:hypothetical protein